MTDHDHFSCVVVHHGFVREDGVVVHTPGEGAETTNPGREILFTIVGNEVAESTGQWARVRWEVLRLLHVHGELRVDDLIELLDEDDHKFVNPSVGWHRNFGNVIAQRSDAGKIELSLTPQGHRLARSN